MLEERRKAQEAADLLMAQECFVVDRQGVLKQLKDLNFSLSLFTTSEVEVTPVVSALPSTLTFKQVLSMLVAHDVVLFNKINT